MAYIGLMKFGWRSTLKASLGLSLAYFAAMLLIDVVILGLKKSGLAGFFVDTKTGKLLKSHLPRIDMTIMVIFVIAFPAIATLLIKLVLIDLTHLQ